ELGVGIEGHGGDDDQADHHLLDVGGDVNDDEAVGQDADQQGADQGASDAALPARQAGPADDDRGDDAQFVIDAGHGFGRTQTRRQQKARQAGQAADDDIDTDDHRLDIDAGQARRLDIAADGVDLAAVARVPQHDMADQGRHGEQDDGHRHAQEAA